MVTKQVYLKMKIAYCIIFEHSLQKKIFTLNNVILFFRIYVTKISGF